MCVIWSSDSRGWEKPVLPVWDCFTILRDGAYKRALAANRKE